MNNYKNGDIVVCIKKPSRKNNPISIFGVQLHQYNQYLVVIDNGKTLTVSKIKSDNDTDNRFVPAQNYPKKYFVSLQEFRKMKINKILNE